MSFGTSGRPPKVTSHTVRCAGCGTSFDFHRERCPKCTTLTADSVSWWDLHRDEPTKRPWVRTAAILVIAVLVAMIGWVIVGLFR